MKKKYNRQSIRLKGYDYSQKGAYFITITTYKNQYLFGKIINGEMILNDKGKMVEKYWNEIPIFYKNFDIDEFIIMPNHIHGIIIINGRGDAPMLAHNNADAPNNADADAPNNAGNHGGIARTLFDIIHSFKGLIINQYIRNVKAGIWEPFYKKVWHRNYYESIIRDEEGYLRIKNYIKNNPRNWKKK